MSLMKSGILSKFSHISCFVTLLPSCIRSSVSPTSEGKCKCILYLNSRIWNTVMVVLIVLLVAVSVLVFTGVISKKCEKDTEELPAIVGLVF